MLDWFLPLHLFETVVLVSFCWRGLAHFHLFIHLRELHFFSNWEVLVSSFLFELRKFIFIIFFLVLILINIFLRFRLLLLDTCTFLDLEILSEMNSVLFGQLTQFFLHSLQFLLLLRQFNCFLIGSSHFVSDRWLHDCSFGSFRLDVLPYLFC